jgi:hypothetical protein
VAVLATRAVFAGSLLESILVVSLSTLEWSDHLSNAGEGLGSKEGVSEISYRMSFAFHSMSSCSTGSSSTL